ncbi:MAG: hypothetical protein AAF791_13910, partial [Bacteroidota bacterium]
MLPRHLLFFFSALGVFNGVLASAYLIGFVRPRRVWMSLAGVLLALFCLRVGVSCFHFFEGAIPWRYIYLGLAAQLIIGPALFTTVRACLTDPSGWSDVNLWHMGVALVGVALVGAVYPFEAHVFVWDHRIRFVIHAIVGAYVVATAVDLYRHRPGSKQTDTPERFVLAMGVFLATTAAATGFAISLVTSYVLGPLVFSFVLYASAMAALWMRRRLTVSPSSTVRYADKKILAPEADTLIARLEVALEEERVFANPDVTVASLADVLDVAPSRLSQLLNDNMGVSFATLINARRV